VDTRQINALQVKAIQHFANGNDAVQARLTIAACAIDRCADGVPPSDHPVLLAMQTAPALAAKWFRIRCFRLTT
jgi:hypothetical protein